MCLYKIILFLASFSLAPEIRLVNMAGENPVVVEASYEGVTAELVDNYIRDVVSRQTGINKYSLKLVRPKTEGGTWNYVELTGDLIGIPNPEILWNTTKFHIYQIQIPESQLSVRFKINFQRPRSFAEYESSPFEEQLKQNVSRCIYLNQLTNPEVLYYFAEGLGQPVHLEPEVKIFSRDPRDNRGIVINIADTPRFMKKILNERQDLKSIVQVITFLEEEQIQYRIQAYNEFGNIYDGERTPSWVF